MAASWRFQMQPDYKNYQNFEELKDGRQTFLNVLPRSHEHVQLGPRLRVLYVSMETFATQIKEEKIKMAMSDVDVSSSLDHDEEPLAELTDEELYNLVQETL